MTCVKHRVLQLHLAISFCLIMMVFANFTGDEFLIFAISSTFLLYSEDNRSSCKIVGGSPYQSYEDCLGDNSEPCDVFYEENCQYYGRDVYLSPPYGEMKTAEECQDRCKLWKVKMKLCFNLMLILCVFQGFGF